jgi:hypothetical protein
MSNKSPEIEAFLEHMSQKVFGRSRKDNVCVACGSTKVKPSDFRDSLSFREWHISRYCQECQDKTFVKEDE